MPEKYQPVSCQLHSELELVIMHQQSIKLFRSSDTPPEEEIITPYDIVSRSGQGEFLLAFTPTREKTEVRLDQISRFEVIKN